METENAYRAYGPDLLDYRRSCVVGAGLNVLTFCMISKFSSAITALITFTERVLTWRKRRALRKKLRQARKNVVLDWIEAFLWAAGVVLLINQFFVQAYEIPSASMRDTLLIEDRLFVNKLIYGPELLPGLVKLPGFASPQRGDVIIFANPDYISRGTAFDIAQRVLYMVTLSLIDIDRDESGEPRAHFLIKRVAGADRDRLRLIDGQVFIQPWGTDTWLPEFEFAEQLGLPYQVRRVITPEMYDTYRAASYSIARRRLGIAPDSDDEQSYDVLRIPRPVDELTLDRYLTEFMFKANPNNQSLSERYAFHELGWFVPSGEVLPLGDNRDDSRDGRFFGPVPHRVVIGRAMFKYWPPSRIGAVR